VYELPNERTKRMDAILSDSSPERMEWEISLLAYIKNGVEYDDERRVCGQSHPTVRSDCPVYSAAS
jgi:hypothetical protein